MNIQETNLRGLDKIANEAILLACKSFSNPVSKQIIMK